MTRLIIALLALTAVCVYADIFPHAPQAPCALTEIVAPCGTFCEPTCMNQGDILCPTKPQICRRGCRCKDGLYRNEATGECSTKEECPAKFLGYKHPTSS